MIFFEILYFWEFVDANFLSGERYMCKIKYSAVLAHLPSLRLIDFSFYALGKKYSK